MSLSADTSTTTALALYDDWSADALAECLGLPRVALFDSVTSTLDVAHALAARGASDGTLVLAAAQSAGRGRFGRTWTSEAGAGVWLTLIERPRDATALEVLSVRVGIALAPVLDPLSEWPVQLKWPNDLYAGGRKLGGILVEARWRDGALDWIAIGVGINVRRPPGEANAASLRDGTSRIDVLREIMPRLRASAARVGPLDAAERAAFAARDLGAGRQCVEPAVGRVIGIDDRGALLVETSTGLIQARTGSLVFKEER
ncbi:MAG TPA: biotin--[acetyl-CoA-carboxylase] ligase [Gemmatimonadaceae bacterium]|nr:biotin--[acetyl-CoA-carboxylase] ligase [Gemmatimonadaceae bacterium]